MNNKIDFKELVELFLIATLNEFIDEDEVPRVNLIFKEEAYKFFYEIMNNPFEIEGYLTPNIGKEDIEKLKELKNNDCPTIYIKDHIKFFTSLTDIVNGIIEHKYGEHILPRNLAMQVMRRIWLRMGVNDFNNVEEFLDMQVDFINNDLLNDYRFETIVDSYYGYMVKGKTDLNMTWDESNKNMSFKIYDEDGNYHSLPHIFYDIKDDICYIYAIQNDFNRKRISKIERKLYKLNKGIDNPNIHPSFVYSMILFIKILKENGINTIKIPTHQVLSYRFHEIMSETTKNKFEKKWTNEEVEMLKSLTGYRREWKQREYDQDLKWYNHVVDKYDLISELKTENLINLIYRLLEQDKQLELINDIDISDVLDIKINNKVKKKI